MKIEMEFSEMVQEFKTPIENFQPRLDDHQCRLVRGEPGYLHFITLSSRMKLFNLLQTMLAYHTDAYKISPTPNGRWVLSFMLIKDIKRKLRKLLRENKNTRIPEVRLYLLK